ncbi:MAG: hypothetical protein RR646_00350 [Erysipelotrichaceae bacterium]
MKKLKSFIYRNKVFVSILLAMVIFLIILIGNYFINPTKNNPNISINEDAEIPNSETNKEEEKITNKISDFTGKFKNDNSIFFNWDLNGINDSIKKVELYYNDIVIANVTGSSSYILPFGIVNIPTGSNPFELRVILESDKIVTSSTNVKIDYILSPNFKYYETIDPTLGKGVILELTYKFSSNTPANVPSINVNDTHGGSVNITYVNTEYDNSSFYTTGKTKYFLSYKEYSPATYSFNITYSFTNLDHTLSYPMTFIIKTAN